MTDSGIQRDRPSEPMWRGLEGVSGLYGLSSLLVPFLNVLILLVQNSDLTQARQSLILEQTVGKGLQQSTAASSQKWCNSRAL